MQLLRLHQPADAQRLDEIIAAFTPRIRRMCPDLGDAVLVPLVERMAQRQLATEHARTARKPARIHARGRARRAAVPYLRVLS